MIRTDAYTQVLEGMPERDPMDFLTMQAGGVAKGRWGEEEEGAGDMEEEEEEGDESMEVRRRLETQHSVLVVLSLVLVVPTVYGYVM